MSDTMFLSGRFAIEQADALNAEHGADALHAAVLRSGHYRAQDNAVMYCRWREVERLMRLGAPLPGALLH